MTMMNRHLIKYKLKPRSQGSAIITLMTFFMVFVVLSVGLVGFELARYQLLISQLKNVLDSATLAGASALAGNTTPPSPIIANPNNNNPPNPNFVPNPNDPPPNSNSNQWAAMQAVNFMFTINQNYGGSNSTQSVLGHPLYNSTTVNYDTTQVTLNAPGANQCNLNIGWVSTLTDQPTTVNDPYAKILSASCTYGYQPLFFKFLNLPMSFVLPSIVQSRAGVSSLDLAICFDLSGSMDDQTPMILVERYLNPQFTNNPNPAPPYNTNYNYYNVPKNNDNYAYNTLCNLTAYYGPLGTSLGVVPAVNLYLYGGGSNPVTGAQANWNFDWQSRYGGNSGNNSFQTPAGQSPNVDVNPPNSGPTNISQSGTSYFTDAVVDIFNTYESQTGNIPTYPSVDFSTSYPGTFTSGNTTITLPTQLGGGSYNFPDIPTLVEASRGNLESTANAQAAGLNISNPGVKPYFQPKSGYYNAYMYAALNIRNPISVGQTAVQNFMSLMNTDVDVHFAFIPFGDSGHSSYYHAQNYGSNAIWGPYYTGTNDFAGYAQNNGWIQPGMGFTAGSGSSASNFTQIYNAIGPTSSVETGATSTTGAGDPAFSLSMSADGGTNIASALQVAAQEFGNGGNSRISQGVTPAVVLFTDGEPDAGGDFGASDPNAKAAARHLGQMGITLYCVGLAQTQTIQTQQQQILQDLVNANNMQGAQAFFIAPGSAAAQKQQLFSAFANIQRGLVGLTQ